MEIRHETNSHFKQKYKLCTYEGKLTRYVREITSYVGSQEKSHVTDICKTGKLCHKNHTLFWVCKRSQVIKDCTKNYKLIHVCKTNHKLCLV